MTTFVMEARENYDPTLAAQLLAATQPDQCLTDPTDFRFDYARGMIMYLGLVAPGTNSSGNFTNATGYTLYDGSTNIYAPSARISTFSNLSPQVMQKDILTDVVTAFQTYSSSATIPAGVGCCYPVLATQGSGYTHAGVSISGGGSMTAEAILDAGGGGYVVDIKVTSWDPSVTSAPTFTITGDGTGATVSSGLSGTGSDGTWRWIGVDFANFLSTPNGPNLVNPRNSNFRVRAESCEVYFYDYANDFAQTTAPLLCQYTAARLADSPLLCPVGVDGIWVYCLTVLGQGFANKNALVLSPETLQTAETTAAAKLAYVIWDTAPFANDAGVRSTFGTDGNFYVFSLYGSSVPYTTGTFTFRLTQFQPPGLGTYGSNLPGTMTDVTGTLPAGLLSDAANYSLTGTDTPLYSWFFMLHRLPATGSMAAVLKLPKEASGSPTDYTKTLISCLYATLSGSPSYDYHSGFIGGYMAPVGPVWEPVGSIPTTGWAVEDCRGFDEGLEQSDYIQPGLDYTKRWLVCQCYPIVAGSVVTADGLMDVLVEYSFVSGSAPTALTLLSDPDWDVNYAAYQAAISQTNVVYFSTMNGVSYENVSPFNFGSNPLLDPGISPTSTKDGSFWLSGVTNPAANNLDQANYNYMFELNSSFTYRAAYNNNGTPQNNLGGITPPFLRLSVGGVVNTGVYTFGEIL